MWKFLTELWEDVETEVSQKTCQRPEWMEDCPLFIDCADCPWHYKHRRISKENSLK